MTNKHQQRGFSLVTAIFLLAVLAVLMVNIVNLGVVQQSTVVMGVQGARAFQAARAGIEFGTQDALNNGSCPATRNLNALGFSITITCSLGVHTEGATPVNVYELESEARFGNYITAGGDANPDFVSRTIRVTVSNNPP